MGNTTYADPRFYPDGVPLVFLSMHNTKNSKLTDFLLSVLLLCENPAFRSRGKCTKKTLNKCNINLLNDDENERVLFPEDYSLSMADMCCCVEPRWDKQYFWQGQFYARPEDMPQLSTRGSPRRCI